MPKCCLCPGVAVTRRCKDGSLVCKNCFIHLFEQDVHETILSEKQFSIGDKIAVGVSGGKDSTVLAYVLDSLNKRYNYGVYLFLIAIDEGIKGYRDDSLKTVEQNQKDYGLPLKVLSYKDLYGWTMDEIVAKVGGRNNCTFCGVFRRQALERGALMVGASKLATGHNADDVAETVILNMLRGDIARLQRSADVTGTETLMPRVKPLRKCFEKEIVMYAHYKKLVYFSTECSYAPNAYRGYAREYVKELVRIRPQTILNLIYSGENLAIRDEVALPKLTTCEKCGFQSSYKLCKACLMLQGLNTNDLDLGIKKKKKGCERRAGEMNGQCKTESCVCTEQGNAELF